MIKNLPTIDDELIVKLRKASENRGLWFFYLMKEAHEKGYDIEDFAPTDFPQSYIVHPPVSLHLPVFSNCVPHG